MKDYRAIERTLIDDLERNIQRDLVKWPDLRGELDLIADDLRHSIRYICTHAEELQQHPRKDAPPGWSDILIRHLRAWIGDLVGQAEIQRKQETRMTRATRQKAMRDTKESGETPFTRP